VILLDTHVVLWVAQVPDLLSVGAEEAIRVERQRDGIGISDKTLWELAMMISRGRVGVKTSLLSFLRAVEQNFTIFPVTAEIADRAVSLSSKYPKDPADRIIGATALVNGFKLITKDARIGASGEVPVVW
jgi:PIN domain nuclease of toxin-antitoxin system